ncbi:MAG: hypothetical protein PUP46_02630 [Endozoicomonas sp. (ex Botrylloides leachii)]|nr:hypothetical protein [Endozoicomonas sp. (ex Botrylloides leachii)]
MDNNINNIRNIQQSTDTVLSEIKAKKTINDNKPSISVDENVNHTIDAHVLFEDIKNTYEGLREGPNLNHELHALVSTVISSSVVETLPRPSMQNTSIDTQKLGDSTSIESAGPANNRSAIRRLQQVLSLDDRFIQQLLDYLQLSSPARKDEHIQNMGLEFKDLSSTLNGFLSKREQLFNQVGLHLEGKLDKGTLKQQLQPIVHYIDPALIIIDNSIAMEEARLNQQRNDRA